MLAISVTVKLHIRVAQQILKWINVKVLEGAFNHEKALGECDCKFSQTFIWSSSQNGIKSPPISHYTRINNNNCETRHCSVVSVGCPLYSDTQLSDSWLLTSWETPSRRWPGQCAPRPTLRAKGRPDHQRHGRHPPSNLESSVSHFSHKASLFSCNLSKSSPRQDPIPSNLICITCSEERGIHHSRLSNSPSLFSLTAFTEYSE